MKRHGMSSHRLYGIWTNIMSRCYNESVKSYADYGARGIKVCDRWLNPQNFISDMESTYQEGLTIERIDCFGNYEPTNCKWISKSEQVNNRRNNILIIRNGITKTLKQWCNELNFSYKTAHRRKTVLKWKDEDLFNPVDKEQLWKKRSRKK